MVDHTIEALIHVMCACRVLQTSFFTLNRCQCFRLSDVIVIAWNVCAYSINMHITIHFRNQYILGQGSCIRLSDYKTHTLKYCYIHANNLLFTFKLQVRSER
jgi:hypothetical protein